MCCDSRPIDKELNDSYNAHCMGSLFLLFETMTFRRSKDQLLQVRQELVAEQRDISGKYTFQFLLLDRQRSKMALIFVQQTTTAMKDDVYHWQVSCYSAGYIIASALVRHQ